MSLRRRIMMMDLLAMLDEVLGESLDAFDHPLININKLYNFFQVNVG